MPIILEREKSIAEITKLDYYMIRMMQTVFEHSQNSQEAAKKAKEHAIAALKELYGNKA